MNKESLRNILTTQKIDLLRSSSRHYLARDLDLSKHLDEEEVTIISGVRRSGKSSLLEQFVKSVHELESLIYINFEDPQLIDFKPEDFVKVYEIWLEKNASANLRVALFDEIQNVEGWERWINFFSKQKGFKVFISGSNSNLLSSELGTHLTGRHRTFTLYPLSFKEIFFNLPTRIKIDQHGVNQEDRVLLEELTRQYLEIGGFPRAWITKDTSILAEYYSDILIRDIAKRKRVKNILALEMLGLNLMSNIGRKINKTKLASSIGLQKGDTVEKYVGYFEECYLGIQVRKYDSSVRRQLRNQPKFYAVDPALAMRAGISSDSKATFYFENLVLLELLRRGGKVYYWSSDSAEIDFIVETKDRKRELVQVCWSLEEESTLKRELKGFSEFSNAFKELRIHRRTILTFEGETREFSEGVLSMPFYQWALLA